jgi:3-phenylpropionate/trans-cinnamate dioxygenase ferredoxin reductase subunit
MAANGMVIVGAGEAGARAALALREHGWEDAITLIGEEAHLPYERPPLSKRLLVEDKGPLPTILTEERLKENAITLLRDRPASALDRAAKEVTLASGARIPYHRLLLATGARPRRLAMTGAEHALYLRTLDDSAWLKSLFDRKGRIVIIGAGFIGLELAASARAKACAVTVIEIAPRVLMRGVPAALAEKLDRRHRDAGVDLKVGTGLAEIGANHVTLADGRRIACDAVIAGIGAVPETALAANAGLAIDNGIQVDEYLATSDPQIYAAGDCCSFAHPLYGGRRIRLEAWRNAQDQGTLAARNMLGHGSAHEAVPWFWSDQHDLTLQIAGLADEGATTVVRPLGDAAEIHFHVAQDGRLVAASGLGPNGAIARDIRLAEMLIAKRAAPAADDLADPDVKLKSLLR